MSDYQFNPSQEQWKEIPGFEGYEISDQGRVRSYWSRIHLGVGIGTHMMIANKPQRIMKQNQRSGYPFVVFTQKGQSTTRNIHRLVLTVFVGPCPLGMESCHEDGNPANPSLQNLRWDTHQNNEADKNHHGTVMFGENHTQSKLTETQVKEIRRLASLGYSNKKLGEMFAVSRSTILLIVKRLRWKRTP